MNRWIIPLLIAAVVVLAPAGHAVATDSADTVDGTDGGTYERSVTIAFDVDSNGTYVLRTATDRLPVAQFSGESGTVLVETGPLDPGEYVLVARDTDDVSYEFAVTSDPDTTETPTNTDERVEETEELVTGDRYEAGTGAGATPSATAATGDATTAASTTPARRTAVDGPGFGPVTTLVATLVFGAAAAGRALW